MTMRDRWKFSYSVEKLLQASIDKMEHALARQQWWEAKKAETLKSIKNEGIEIDMSIADLSYAASTVNNTWGGRQTNVTIKPELLKDLNECIGKIEEHRGRAKQYDAWKQVFSSQFPMEKHELTQDDWMYFFGK